MHHLLYLRDLYLFTKSIHERLKKALKWCRTETRSCLMSTNWIMLWHILQFQLLSLLKSIIENASKSSMKSSFLLFKIFTFEKQAPICTLGVGGKPLEMGCCCCFKGSPLRLPEFSMPVGDDLLADLSRRRGGALGEVLDPSSAEKETQVYNSTLL